MKIGTLDFIAPGLMDEPWTEAEVFGSAVWLWMHSTSHREAPLHMLSALLLPAIKHKQFILASENGKPIFYLSWANLSEDAESRYIKNPSYSMPENDWNSGDRMWILDWVAPFGHTKMISRLLARTLFAKLWMRTLYHRGRDRGLRIITFHGIAVISEAARFWFETHPVMSGEETVATPNIVKPSNDVQASNLDTQSATNL